MPATIVSVSGGKDSTASYTLAVERGRPFRSTFSDVGNEAPQTYDYIRELPEKVGGPDIEWVQADLSERVRTRARNLPEKWHAEGIPQARIDEALEYLKPTGNPFLDACFIRAGFPSATRRFCTDWLKVQPVCQQIYKPIIEAGRQVICWSGVRRDESQKRQSAQRFERDQRHGVKFRVYRPLLDWSEDDVFAYLKRMGIAPNPLYAEGAKRVGCFPCIFAHKDELKFIAERYPEQVERLREWERLVNLVGLGDGSTFFQASAIPGVTAQACFEQGLTEPKYLVVEKDGKKTRVKNPEWVSPLYDFRKHGIDCKVEWSRTDRGGRQFGLLHDAQADHAFNASESCGMLGYCE